MDESFFEKIHHKSDYELPPSYNREIGRVIVRWAFFEHQVQARFGQSRLQVIRWAERLGDFRL
jgi:hypothetical protein